MKINIEKIDWLDAKGVSTSWEHTEDSPTMDLCMVSSVGYVIEEDDQKIVLCPNMGNDQVLGLMAIPKVNIQGRKVLK